MLKNIPALPASVRACPRLSAPPAGAAIPPGHFQNLRRALPSLILLALAGLAAPQRLFATANYVYHERTANNPGCGAGNYVNNLTPTAAQSVTVRCKVEYQFYTDRVRVYYTTNGSAPSGSFGTGSGTTTVVTGAYDCNFSSGGVVDVASATIPAQPAGTTVKYIISAWHSGGGAEIFANSGEFSSPFTTSSQASVFQYTVAPTTYTFNGGASTDWATAANWSTGIAPTTALLLSGDAVVIAANCVMNDVVITFPTNTSLTVSNAKSLTASLNTYITLNAGANLTVQTNATLYQGRVFNSGTMDIYGNYTAFYMTDNSSGVLNIKAGGSYSCPACAEAMNAGSLINNEGTMHTGTANTWQGRVNNLATGVITDGGNGSQLTFGASSVVNNYGSLVSRTARSSGLFTNQPTGTLSMPGTCNFTVLSGGTFVNDGLITLPSSDNLLNLSAGGTLLNNATLKGVGTLARSGTFNNSSTGVIAPGLSPGKFNVSGSLDLGNGTYNCEINGPGQGTTYDWLAVTGAATLSNASLVVNWGAFTPVAGQVYTVMTFTSRTGNFSSVTIPPVGSLSFIVGYTATSVQIAVSPPAAALDFDGSNDFVSTPNSAALHPTTALTMEAWVKPTGGGNYARIADTSEATLISKWGGGNNFTFLLNVNGSQKAIIAPTAYTTGTWYHVAGTYDGSAVKLYVNGTLIDSVAATGPITTSANALRLGLGHDPYYFQGQMDEFRLWNRSLCQDEIQARMNCEPAGTENGLVVYYNFNQGVAGANNAGITTLTNRAAGGGNNATLSNFALTGPNSNWVWPGGVTSGNSCGTYTAPEIALRGGSPLATISDGDSTPDTSDGTDFGTANVTGGTVARTFMITNSGNGILAVSGIARTGSHAADFTVSGITLPATVIAGGYTNFTVTFDPSAAGLRTATLYVTNNDCDEALYDFAIQGTGGVPEIGVQQPVGTDLVDGSANVDFGTTNLASSSAPRTFIVTNSGNGTLILTNITKNGSHSGDFSVSALGSTNLAPNSATTFTVSFAPSATGARSAAIHIANTDSDENPFDINLSGTGVSIVASNATYARAPETSLKITIAAIARDLNSLPVKVQSLGAGAQNAALTFNNTYIFYAPANNNNDSFTYTVTNTANAAATGTITVTVATSPGGLATALTVSGGTVTVKFFGIPGMQYDVERTTSLEEPATWTLLTSGSPFTAGTDGSFTCTDNSAPNGTAYYRSRQH